MNIEESKSMKPIHIGDVAHGICFKQDHVYYMKLSTGESVNLETGLVTNIINNVILCLDAKVVV